MIYQYQVVSLDVWGNDQDGYEINNLHKIGNIEFDFEPSDKDELLHKQIVTSLKGEGYLFDSVTFEQLDFEPLLRTSNIGH
jgi:hypothetical protein